MYIYATAYLQNSVRYVRLLHLAQIHVTNGLGYAIQNTESLFRISVIKKIYKTRKIHVIPLTF